MVFPDFTDLRKIALALKGDAKFERLRRTIESAWHAQSCYADLAQASDACEALSALRLSPRQRGSLGRATTENALLVTGVMLYVRATGTGGSKGERGAIQLDDKHLTPEQRIDHGSLCEIRNRALAHVYRDSPIADSIWHEDLVFAVNLDGFGWKPAIGSHRISFHVPTFDMLLRQIPVAEAILLQATQKRMDAMTRMINEAAVPLELFQQFRFDPVSTFGSIDGVQAMLAGIPNGEATVMIDRPKAT